MISHPVDPERETANNIRQNPCGCRWDLTRGRIVKLCLDHDMNARLSYQAVMGNYSAE